MKVLKHLQSTARESSGKSYRLVIVQSCRIVSLTFIIYSSSVENIKFWSEVNEFHGAVDKLRDSEGSSTHDEKDILTFAKEIYQTFIVEGAQMQINISEAQSLSITQRLESNESTVSRDLFDKAQKEIYVLMSRHSYPRFLSSNGNRSYKKREEEKIKTKKSSVLPDNT